MVCRFWWPVPHLVVTRRREVRDDLVGVGCLLLPADDDLGWCCRRHLLEW